MKTYEIIAIRESGYPDVLDYEGNGAVVISWWVFTFKNKKSGEFDLPNETKKEMPTSMRFLYYYAKQAFEPKKTSNPHQGNGGETNQKIYGGGGGP